MISMLSVILALPLLQGLATTAAGAPPRRAAGYAGSKACMTECHVKSAETFAATAKGKLFLEHPQNETERLGCEGCHGPGAAHIESGGEDMTGMIRFGKKTKNTVAERNVVCLQCHEKTARVFWQGSAHESRDVACADCHDVMANRSGRSSLKQATVLATCTQCHMQRKGQQLLNSHMPVREGKLECTGCHNPHGSPNEKLLTASSVNEVCYSCHAEKRGPFLWEHEPVSENCSNCHDPHGSNHEKMLKTIKPRLCQQCHMGTGHPTRAFALSDTRFLDGRQCANCHTMIHGSNHPSGFAFTR